MGVDATLAKQEVQEISTDVDMHVVKDADIQAFHDVLMKMAPAIVNQIAGREYIDPTGDEELRLFVSGLSAGTLALLGKLIKDIVEDTNHA